MALHRLNFSKAGFVLIASMIAIAATDVRGATYTYTQDTDATGVWSENNRWGAGAAFPNAVDDVAILAQPITTGPDVTVPTTPVYSILPNNQTVTIGTLDIQNGNQLFLTHIGDGTLADGNIIFQSSSGNAQIHEEAGTTNTLNRTRFFTPITVNSDLDIVQDANPTLNTSTEILGKINGSAARTINKSGTGNLQLAYTGTFNSGEGFFGTINIQNGGIRLIGASAISNASAINVSSGGQLQVGNAVTNVALGAGGVLTLNGTGKTTGANPEGALRYQLNAGIDSVFSSPIVLSSDSRIRVNVAGTSGTLTNTISGPGKLSSDAGGLLILSGANTYQGGTALSNNSKLIVNNTTGSGVGTGAVTLASANNVLGGTGTIGTPTAPVNVSLAGSALNPGNVDLTNDAGNQPSLPGTLTINGDLTFTAAAKLNIDLSDTVSDKLVVNGNVTLGTAATLNLPSFTPATVHSYTLIDNQGATAISGAFSNYAEGATVTLGANNYTLTYLGGTGNDLVLRAPGLLGDYNGNGAVDAADYVLWRKGGPLQNEADNQGIVNGQDYVEWRARFGNSAGSGTGALVGSTAVPEPTTAFLVLFGLVALADGSRKR
jgi:hypothetical protein